MLSKTEVKNLADLAKLELSEEEINLYQHQLKDVLAYVEKINKLDLSKVKESLTGVEGRDIIPPRPDEIGKSDPSILKQAKMSKDNYVKSPHVFEK